MSVLCVATSTQDFHQILLLKIIFDSVTKKLKRFFNLLCRRFFSMKFSCIFPKLFMTEVPALILQKFQFRMPTKNIVFQFFSYYIYKVAPFCCKNMLVQFNRTSPGTLLGIRSQRYF